MKKFSFKSFMLGVLVTVLIAESALPGLAAATMKTAELYYNSIKVKLNGKILDLRDTKGNPVEPFVMNGTTYLPVRAIAEALGLPVSWDAETQTVVLGQDPEYNQPAAWLGDLKTFTGEHRYFVNDSGIYEGIDFMANDGSTYERYWYPDTKEVIYLLNDQYSKFTGTIYLTEDAKNAIQGFKNGRSRYLIYLDDRLVYTSDEIKPGSLPCEFSIDVTNAYKMKIVHQWDHTGYSGFYNSTDGASSTPIGNPALWK
ncbi:copper amine oxidase domain protein [Thermoclostridium stercorarium subsp. stercorarium DSM 8532]|uniref:Copper amine oxidase domain protein n=2 Tax=Thermoclostridium stercorarium TaxID=1510 RepID=L7VPW9_THES1|nr:stalk domain-containing protein [Thermoclostridium stercorarium]AGC68852.1 copper amine oxidase domain protein [Thermoclostridium stercorarium subsp. stercorarium DSM 8532]AGI39849.1 copper amine oxidase [Thermoclostridium stercorarium subsp. stercorarium DSM 8532]ANW99157.1 copper amine oxidase [Thermoclostridium stercorarium subsp. thermolacticum DSM 2910]